jgi:hypothetical protein
LAGQDGRQRVIFAQDAGANMAMLKCKECGNEVSSMAEACPNCGAKIPHYPIKKALHIIYLVAAILVVAGIAECSFMASGALHTPTPISKYSGLMKTE